MKNIHYLLFLLIVPIVFAQPKITNYINDYSNIITEPEYSQISSIAQRLQKSGAA